MNKLIVDLGKIYLVFFFLLLGCQVESVQVIHPPFFDLNDFFKKELSLLSDLKQIKKKVILNGKVEEKMMNEFDLAKDLEIFTASNINKMAWLDKYKVDSLTNVNGLLEKVTYHALDDKLKTREIIVDYLNGDVKSISINNTSSNQVASLNQTLKYISKEGYSITSSQEVSLAAPQKLSVEVKFEN